MKITCYQSYRKESYEPETIKKRNNFENADYEIICYSHEINKRSKNLI